MFVVDLDRGVPVCRVVPRKGVSATTRQGLGQRAWYFAGGLALCAVLAGADSRRWICLLWIANCHRGFEARMPPTGVPRPDELFDRVGVVTFGLPEPPFR